MTAIGQDSLNTRSTLDVGGKPYAYYSLNKAAAELGDISRLPFSMKVLLENLLSFASGLRPPPHSAITFVSSGSMPGR